MSTFMVGAEVSFGIVNVSQIYATQRRGDVTVFMLSWFDSAGTTSFDGFLAMRHLGSGQVEFGAPLVTPAVQWGPHFVYDDIFVDTKNSTPDANGLATYRVNPDLSISEVSLQADHDWIGPPLVNLVTHEVFDYSSNGNTESYCHKVAVAPDGTMATPVLTWTGAGDWQFDQECTRIDDTTFVDAVWYEDPYPGPVSWWEDAVILDLANDGIPVVGTLNPPSGMPAGGGWNGTIYSNATALPASNGHFLIEQSGGGTTILCEMRKTGTTLEVVNTFDADSQGLFQGGSYWTAQDKLLVPVADATPPYPGASLYDPWGVNESYGYTFPNNRTTSGSAPTDSCPDGGFFIVHQDDNLYPFTDARIVIYYVPTPVLTNRIGWGYLAQ